MDGESQVGADGASGQAPALLGLPLPILLAVLTGVAIVMGTVCAPGIITPGGGGAGGGTLGRGTVAELMALAQTNPNIGGSATYVIDDVVSEIYAYGEDGGYVSFESAPENPLPFQSEFASHNYQPGDAVVVTLYIYQYTDDYGEPDYDVYIA